MEELLPALRKLAKKFRADVRDDLVSEAIIAIYAAKERYRPELGEFTPYALRTAFCAMTEFVQTNHVVHVNHSAQWRHKQVKSEDAKNTFRHAFIKCALSAYEPLVEMCNGNNDPNVKLEDDEELDAMRASIQKLDAQEREIITLKYAHEMSTIRISEKTGIPIKRVGRIISRAMVSLRSNLLWFREE